MGHRENREAKDQACGGKEKLDSVSCVFVVGGEALQMEEGGRRG